MPLTRTALHPCGKPRVRISRRKSRLARPGLLSPIENGFGGFASALGR